MGVRALVTSEVLVKPVPNYSSDECPRRLGSGGAQLTADGCFTSHGCYMTSPSTGVYGGAGVCYGADSLCCDDDGGRDGAQSLFAPHHSGGGLAVSVLLIVSQRQHGTSSHAAWYICLPWCACMSICPNYNASFSRDGCGSHEQ